MRCGGGTRCAPSAARSPRSSRRRVRRVASSLRRLSDLSGRLKTGWSACAWRRTATRLGFNLSSLPNGRVALRPGYDWCAWRPPPPRADDNADGGDGDRGGAATAAMAVGEGDEGEASGAARDLSRYALGAPGGLLHAAPQAWRLLPFCPAAETSPDQAFCRANVFRARRAIRGRA